MCQAQIDGIPNVHVVASFGDPKVYEMPIKKYNCKPENICFLSSNTWDISGGGVFGYNAVWVNRYNKIFDKLGYNPRYIINNLKQLLELV